MTEFKNPNLESGGEKRIFIVFGLTFLAIMISQLLLEQFSPKQQPQPAQQQQQAQQAPPSPNQVASGTTPATQSAASASAPAKSATTPVAPAIPAKQAAAEQETIIENELFRIVFTNKGAVAKSWVLKKHTDDKNQPLDLVHHSASAKYGYPLGFFSHDDAVTKRLNEAMYVPSVTGPVKAPATLTFEFSDGEFQVRKTFKFDHTYTLHLETSVTRNGAGIEALPAWPAALGDQNNAPAYAGGRVTWMNNDRVEYKAPFEGFFGKSWMTNRSDVGGPFNWVGLADQYFGAIFMPDEPAKTKLVQLHNAIPMNPDEQDAEKKKKEVFSVLGVAVGDPDGTTSGRMFVGPKNLKELNSVRAYAVGQNGGEPRGPDLEGVVEFGTFGIIAKPLFLWLAWTHDKLIPNWGWAIIFLTICINVALFPLRYPGMKMALLQQKVAPEVKAINKRYEGIGLTDPRQREKQQEIQKVWDREGIKPAAGCLPMLIQLPFLFAFYQMLTVVNELRHAPWLWVKDLASPDPYYLMPILITVSMYAMQKITPMSGMDPAQVKMMQIMMPLMIGLFSWSLPAGLGVYWFTGNLIGFGMQYYMNNSKMAREVREHLAKRAERKKR